jgi:hypothetical protein
MSRAIAGSLTQGIRRYRSEAVPLFRCCRSVRTLAFIYVFGICVVATILFVSVDEIEPNPRLALTLKFLIVFVSAVAIAGRLMLSSADGLSALMP